MLIRRETDADITSIDSVHRAAFARDDGEVPPEVRLIQRLRADQSWVPALALVAEHPTRGLVGHVVCTVGNLDNQAALGLGPLGVLPEHQRSGVGHALMHAVLGAADAMEFGIVVLLGHIDYYWHFGFVAARSIGVDPPDPTWDEHFQARRLHAWSDSLRGTFQYAQPFTGL